MVSVMGKESNWKNWSIWWYLMHLRFSSCVLFSISCRQKFKVFIICWSDGSAIRVSRHTLSLIPNYWHSQGCCKLGLDRELPLILFWDYATLSRWLSGECLTMWVFSVGRCLKWNETSTLQDTCRPCFHLFSHGQGIEVLGQPETPRPRAAIVSFMIRYGNAPGGRDLDVSCSG